MDPDENTEELKALTRERELSEQELADTSSDEEEAAQHRRRAEKTGYLRQKLEERERSEQEAEAEDG